MGLKENIISLCFVAMFIGAYDVFVKPLIQDYVMAEGGLYSWGMATFLTFISGSIGLVVAWVLMRRRHGDEIP